jgi:hypothetical protein
VTVERCLEEKYKRKYQKKDTDISPRIKVDEWNIPQQVYHEITG